MGKNKKPRAHEAPEKAAKPYSTDEKADSETVTEAAASSSPAVSAVPPSTDPHPVANRRLQRFLPDLVKAAVALGVIAVAVAIWYQPPLIQVDHPYVTYLFGGKTFKDAKLYRPVAMPTRFYVELPHPLTDRYAWFAIDRRREVAALADPPRHHLAGHKAIRRSDPLGLDLEFRKLDHSEWQIHFYDESIIFSNAVLCVRLDIKNHSLNGQK